MTQTHSESTPPPHWPKHVKIISMEGLAHIGVDPKTSELYWDGQKLVTERKLAGFERGLATVATIATCLGALAACAEAGRSLGWW